uniref:Dynein heavy chain tail domain-containing protein n=1 Tax=Timema monikensis TaxID=170555 RepID=A0A7R9DX96_9NEOP|nr:unnamed protein product [Timema monikensis]
MGEAQPEKKEDEEDLRLTFMFDYLQKTMRLKQERWTKMLATEELEKILMDFLNGRVADEVLVMTLNPAGQLIPVLGFPASIRNKAVYFIKRDKETITGENFRRRLVFGDIAPKPVDELATLVEEVFVPLLSNPMNHKGWPKVAADDVIKHVHELKNAVYEVQGKISGQTMLPMPIGVERVYQVEQDLVDRFVHSRYHRGSLTVDLSYGSPTVDLSYGSPTVDLSYGSPTVYLSYGSPTVDLSYGSPTVDLSYGSPTVDLSYGSPIGSPIFILFLTQCSFQHSNGETIDLQMKSDIEAIVIKWVSQVNDVLQEDSVNPLNEDPFPTPLSEVKFWDGRVKNLQCVYTQLREPRVEKMASILELTESTYFPPFKNMFRNVVASLTEAKEISLYLKPLIKYFEKMELLDFNEIEPLFRPMLHTICLIWVNSRYYCNVTKLIILIKEIANLLIHQASKYLDPSALLEGDVDECRDSVLLCLRYLETFRLLFEEYRAKLPAMFKEGHEPVPWTFHPKLAFGRMFLFVERLKKIDAFFACAQEFLRLEKVEFGGIKGRALTNQIVSVFQEFNDIYAVFHSITYDPLSPEDDSFCKDYETFVEKVEDLDRKLATIFSMALDDCYNLESFFKLCLKVVCRGKEELLATSTNQRCETCLVLEGRLTALKQDNDNAVAQ